MITEDTRAVSYPINKEHVKLWDKNKTAQFVRHHGERSAVVDKRMGIDYDIYHALNMQA